MLPDPYNNMNEPVSDENKQFSCNTGLIVIHKAFITVYCSNCFILLLVFVVDVLLCCV